MWRIGTALLCVFMAMSTALKSNSSLLESKIARRVHDVGYEFKYFGRRELESVVVIRVMKGRYYIMVCMANMISPKVGLTAEKCESNVARAVKRPENHILIADTYKEYLLIHGFISVDKHIQETTNGSEDHSEIALIVLKYSMTFSKSPPPLPLLGTEINEHKGITIGRNMLQTCAEGKQLLKVDVYVKAEEEDRFFVELCNIRTKFTYEDEGGPIFSGDTFVGILTDHQKGTVIKVLEYKSHIQEIATSNNLGELYLNERI